MVRNGPRLIETFIASDFLEELGPANQQIRCESASIKSFDQQLKQCWIRREQFKEQSAQPVGFDETDELVQCGVGIGGLPDFGEQCWTEFCENLFCSGRDVGSRCWLQ